jgi:hypothetical protein
VPTCILLTQERSTDDLEALSHTTTSQEPTTKEWMPSAFVMQEANKIKVPEAGLAGTIASDLPTLTNKVRCRTRSS